MSEFIYVDNSNLYIEGRRASAVAQGLADNIHQAMEHGILDHAYTISFGKLHEFLTGDDLSQTKRIALFGSRPPPNDGIWRYAGGAGFELHLEDRNRANKEKRIDTGIVTLMMKDAFRNGNPAEDTFILVAGDGDFVPAIRTVKEEGYKFELVFWSHASRELKNEAHKFVCLNEHLDALRLG